MEFAAWTSWNPRNPSIPQNPPIHAMKEIHTFHQHMQELVGVREYYLILKNREMREIHRFIFRSIGPIDLRLFGSDDSEF